MKFFIIEIEKPTGEGYRKLLQEKINKSEFEVVKVCGSFEEAEREQCLFVIKNVKSQSGFHYEVIAGEGTEGYMGLQKELSNFYNRIA